MKLEGKVAIITGAGSGMGAEEAKMFAAEGARVVITDINAEACRKVADEIGEAAIAIEHDVANEEGWGVVVATTLEKFGKIDILVNNAGLTKADTFDNTDAVFLRRSEEHTSELQSLMRISYAVFCLKKKTHNTTNRTNKNYTTSTEN